MDAKIKNWWKNESQKGEIALEAASQSPGCALILIVLVLAVGLTFLLYTTETGGEILDLMYNSASNHAVEKHGEVSETINSACQGGGIGTFLNPKTGRKAVVCKIEVDGKEFFGVGVYENGNNVTAFLKEKMKSSDEVIRYLENAGYIK
jgi:hypothetical protein